MTSLYIPGSSEVEEDEEAILAGKVKLLLNLFSIFLTPSEWLSKLKNSFECKFEADADPSEFIFGLLESPIRSLLASSARPVRAWKKVNPFGHLMSFSWFSIIFPIWCWLSAEWGRRNMWGSSFGKLSLEALCWNAGEGRSDGFWLPQLKIGGGGRIWGADCFEGMDEVDEVLFLFEEKSWER